jgi:MFS family permease
MKPGAFFFARLEMKQSATYADSTRSIRHRYYAVWCFYSFGPSFIFAIYPLFLRSRGLNQFQVNTVAAVFFFVWFLTDVPTGAFADAIGRRASVVIGCGFHVASFLLYYFSYSYWHFIVAEILDALGLTLGNGPIDAWAVDTLDAAGFEGAKDRIFARQFQIVRLAGMTGALVGAYVARSDIALPFLLSAGTWAVAGLAALFLMHDAHEGRPPRRHNLAREIRERMVDSMRTGFANRSVTLMSLVVAVGSAAWAPWWQEWPRYFTESFGARIEVMGWLFAGFSLGQMVGAELVNRIQMAWQHRAAWLIAVSAAMSSATFAVALLSRSLWTGAALFIAANAALGAFGPVLTSWYNEQIEGENRATLLSFQSTFGTFGSAAGLPFQGAIMDRLGASASWLTMGLFCLLQVPCLAAIESARAQTTVEPNPRLAD